MQPACLPGPAAQWVLLVRTLNVGVPGPVRTVPPSGPGVQAWLGGRKESAGHTGTGGRGVCRKNCAHLSQKVTGSGNSTHHGSLSTDKRRKGLGEVTMGCDDRDADPESTAEPQRRKPPMPSDVPHGRRHLLTITMVRGWGVGDRCDMTISATGRLKGACQHEDTTFPAGCRGDGLGPTRPARLRGERGGPIPGPHGRTSRPYPAKCGLSSQREGAGWTKQGVPTTRDRCVTGQAQGLRGRALHLRYFMASKASLT